MGIQGLLPLLKSTTTPVHIKDYSGMVAAVDTYSWLHKGAFACSKEICLGLSTTKFIDYCMTKVNLLRRYGVKPLLVFDGGPLPMKEEQEIKRARSRKLNLERALEHEQSGNTSAAYDCYQKAVDISPQIAFQLIKVLRQEQVPYIVAPFEADAQLAFLSIQGHADVIITEDSDTIPFGCKKVLFKMDKFGQGVEFRYDDLCKNRDLIFTSFTKQMILEMCILSGCDYLASLQGMGLKRAHNLIRKFGNYHKIIKHLKFNGVSVPPSYEEMFTRAILTFHHQQVYDPVLEEIVHLTPLPSDTILELDFLGSSIPKQLGQAIARGEVDPVTGVPFEVTDFGDQRDAETTKNNSIGVRKRQLDLPIQKNLVTNYFLSASSEAKRQFRAPRSTSVPFNDNLDEMKENIRPSIRATEPTKQTSCFQGFSYSATDACRTSEFISSKDEEEQIVNFLDSKLESSVPLQSNVTGKGSAEPSISKHSYIHKDPQGKCVVRSAFFSKSKVILEPPSEVQTQVVSVDVYAEAMAENKCRGHFDVYNTTSATERIAQFHFGKGGQTSVSAVTYSGKSPDQISAEKHVPDFNSTLLGDGVNAGNFCSDTSHIEYYASVAKKSMETFVSSITPMRSSGSRASGLRKPARTSPTERVVRNHSTDMKTVEDFSKYAYAPSNCRSSVGGRNATQRIENTARLKESLVTE